MKKKRTSPGKLFYSKWPVYFILPFVFLITSCNNGDKKSDSTKSDTVNIVTEESKMLKDSAAIKDEDYQDDDTAAAVDRRIADKTWYMKLSAEKLKRLMKHATNDDNDVKQLRLKFVKSGDFWGLEVKGKRKRGWSETKDTLETLKDIAPVDNPNKLERRNQRIYRGELKTILGEPDYTDVPILPDTKFKDIYFKVSEQEHPDYPGQKIMYLLYSKNLAALQKLDKRDDETGDSNPSPPKENCVNDCDDPPPPLTPPKKRAN